MSNFSLGNRESHYNPDEPRDWHGRWTGGGPSGENTPLGDLGAVGRASILLGHARAGAKQRGAFRAFKLPSQAEAERFARLLAAWNAASGLDDARFAEWFTRGLDIGPVTLGRLRKAAAGAAQARTFGQVIEASHPLAAAIQEIGGDRWPEMLERLEDQAERVGPGGGTGHFSGLAAGDRPDHGSELWSRPRASGMRRF